MSNGIKQRYLTKTRFKLAVECPTKLFYTSKNKIYADTKQEDDFLKALAEGGFQVGELAKLMYPGGHDIKSLQHEEALQQTRELLAQDVVTIYEAAVQHGNLFVRVDILRKVGNQVALIEVKAKSFDSTSAATFKQKSGGIKKEMLPYLQDVAFQYHVLSLAYPQWHVNCFLMLADKSKTCTVDGLNQKFKIHRQKDGRASVQVTPGTRLEDLGEPILSCVNVDPLVHEILANPIQAPGTSMPLAQLVQDWGEIYRTDTKIDPVIGAHCAKCEFRSSQGPTDLKSGFHECWRQALGWTDEQIDQGTVLDVWNFRRKQELMDLGVLRLDQVSRDDLKYEEAEEGLSPSQRQWMQVSKTWPGGGDFYLDRQLVSREMASWQYPLHFIDFETARVALPFFAGQRPYDNIAFQFSHHEMQADGAVAHKSQFLSTTPGVRPNYEFVRQLKKAVGDKGTVFMWWPHENTTLNAILDELNQDKNLPEDAADIRAAILELTVVKDKKKVVRSGNRAMVDLCRFASLAFFHPSTKASSSIKKVLPAVMQSSAFLKERYSKPIYGAEGGIPSLNFKEQVWWQATTSGAENPYTLLPSVFEDVSQGALEAFESNEDMAIAEGGAATTAFSRLQFDNLTDEERQQIEFALLRYCELDTLAMVMIYEAWRDWNSNK